MKNLTPVIGQVYKVKPTMRRDWRADVITINFVQDTPLEGYSPYFTYVEMEYLSSSWSYDLLELYILQPPL